MAVAPFNHGVRVLTLGEEPRAIEVADVSTIGAVVTATDLDTGVFPYDEPVHFYGHEADKVAALGATGAALDVVNAVRGQGPRRPSSWRSRRKAPMPTPSARTLSPLALRWG